MLTAALAQAAPGVLPPYSNAFGKVWYLFGTTDGTAERSITIPTGAAVFFPIVNYIWINTPEFGDPPWSEAFEAEVRALLAELVNMSENMVLENDGKAYPDVYALRAPSPVAMCSLPPVDNILGVALEPVPRERLVIRPSTARARP